MNYKNFLNEIEDIKKEIKMSQKEKQELKDLIMSKIGFSSENLRPSFISRLA